MKKQITNEILKLRKKGLTQEDIAELVSRHFSIKIGQRQVSRVLIERGFRKMPNYSKGKPKTLKPKQKQAPEIIIRLSFEGLTPRHSN